VLASFTDADPSAPLSDYKATITWGNGTTSAGTIAVDAQGGYCVSGGHTYATAGTYAVTVLVTDAGGSSATVATSLAVTNLGKTVQPGQTASPAFWLGPRGQALLRSFNVTSANPNPTALANWLATTFPDLYGKGAGANNLSGKTNAQVAAFYVSLFGSTDGLLAARILDTALDLYATTLSLGGTAARAYGFQVSADGLGANSWSLGRNGPAFGVPNNTTLNVYQILRAADQQAAAGLWGTGNAKQRRQMNEVFEALLRGGRI
jgi:hypothetical protein